VPEAQEEKAQMNVLEEANNLVHGDRAKDYEHPYEQYKCVADVWRSLILRRYKVDVPLTADFACLLMAALKTCREAGKPKRDNRVDGPGYFECEEMCIERNNANAQPSNPVVQEPVYERLLNPRPDNYAEFCARPIGSDR
jgi:hypothetical protein